MNEERNKIFQSLQKCEQREQEILTEFSGVLEAFVLNKNRTTPQDELVKAFILLHKAQRLMLKELNGD